MKKNNKSLYIRILVILIILVELIFLSYRHHIRLDTTKDKHYTLSYATKHIIKNLDQPVTIIAYFSKKLPPNLLSVRRELINTLDDYKNISGGKIIYKIVDPNKDEETEKQAIQDGISPVIVEIHEKDQAKQQKAFMGLVIKYKKQKQVIPYIDPNSPLEYLLTMNIKKLSTTKKPPIAILQGFGSPNFSQMQGFINALSVLYTPVVYNFDSTNYNLNNYKILAIIDPKDSIPEQMLNYLDKFLNNGGKIFLAFNTVKGNLSQNPPMGTISKNGINKWLEKYGLKVFPKFIIDAQCGNIQVKQSNFPLPLSISFPYFPLISNFADHPITKGLEAVAMSFASPMEFQGDTNKIKFIPLAYTSEHTGLENPPIFFSVMRQWKQSDFPLKHLVVGGILHTDKWDIVVFSDGSFMQLPAGEQFEHSDNIALAVNSIDWLSDDLGISQLRTKGISYKPIKQLSDSTKQLIKYINFIIPIIIILIIGLFRWKHNSIKRKNLNS